MSSKGYDQSEAAKKFRELDADGSGYLEGLLVIIVIVDGGSVYLTGLHISSSELHDCVVRCRYYCSRLLWW